MLMSSINLKKQDGATLIWAMVTMMVLSIVVVATSRSSTMDRIITTNGVLQKLAYQGAESAIENTAIQAKLVDTVMNGVPNADGNLEKTYPEETIGKITIQGTIEYLGNEACTTIPRIAMSTELTTEIGGVTCQIFRVRGVGKVKGTSASDTHEIGITQFVPVRTEIEL